MVAFELELGGYQDTAIKNKIIILLYLRRETAYCSVFCSNTAQTLCRVSATLAFSFVSKNNNTENLRCLKSRLVLSPPFTGEALETHK